MFVCNGTYNLTKNIETKNVDFCCSKTLNLLNKLHYKQKIRLYLFYNNAKNKNRTFEKLYILVGCSICENVYEYKLQFSKE